MTSERLSTFLFCSKSLSIPIDPQLTSSIPPLRYVHARDSGDSTATGVDKTTIQRHRGSNRLGLSMDICKHEAEMLIVLSYSNRMNRKYKMILLPATSEILSSN